MISVISLKDSTSIILQRQLSIIDSKAHINWLKNKVVVTNAKANYTSAVANLDRKWRRKIVQTMNISTNHYNFKNIICLKNKFSINDRNKNNIFDHFVSQRIR